MLNSFPSDDSELGEVTRVSIQAAKGWVLTLVVSANPLASEGIKFRMTGLLIDRERATARGG